MRQRIVIRLVLLVVLTAASLIAPLRTQASTCPCSIWGATATPTTPAANDPNAAELGVKFQADVTGFITGIRFYKGSGNTSTHTGNLWSTSGQKLATATFSGETATGWQQVTFATPVQITANTTYVASYHTDTGNFAEDDSFFATAGVDNAPLHALKTGVSGGNGVYIYGASAFPTQTFQAANYWVDVVFTTSVTPDTTPPTVTSTSPTSGATGVNSSTNVSVTFSEALNGTTINATTVQLLTPTKSGVAASVTYNAATWTATVAPNSSLAASTTYTIKVLGGTSGVKDLAGNALATTFTSTFTVAGPGPCTSPANPIVAENCLAGNPASEWDVSGAGDQTIQGFATDISVNRGSTMAFKVKTNATSYRIDIYRLGYYGGTGARKVATVQPAVTLPQTQPACLTDITNKLMDCGRWTISASWPVPAGATSGIYIARLVRADTGGASHMIFIVRDDASHSDLLFQTSDMAWQAYNDYGGASLYGSNGVQFDQATRGFKVSYNRPFHTRAMESGVSWVFNAEYPMVRWIEANGYDVAYFTGVDAARFGNLILNHKVYMPVGHDEYWSGTQRTNVEAARNAGVNLAFFSGNGVFWKTRWENSVDGSNTPFRTLVSYKETHANAVIDPQDPPTWTGTWRDPRFSPPADGGRPENALMGTMFMVNGPRVPPDPFLVPAADGQMRFWRNTSIASLAAGQVATLPAGTLGFEWDVDADNGFRPAGLIRLSTTTVSMSSDYLLDYGSTYGAGSPTHALTLYRHASGALVFGAGTVQWSWGLDANHDHPNYPAPAPDVRMQQATVNLLADMRVQPTTLQTSLLASSASTDTSAPTSVITTPASGATVTVGTTITIQGAASDTGGGVIGGTEVSVDGGSTWHPANGRGSWSYSWTPTAPGSVTIKSRAVDDSGNLEAPAAGIAITVAAAGGSQPSVTAISPQSGSTAGGTVVTISGTNFAPGATVSFGATVGTNTIVQSATSLTVNAPAHPAGIVDVTVTTGTGTSTTSLADQFTYVMSLMGDSNIEATQDNNPAGIAEAFQYTASASGSATTLSLYLDSSNTATQVVVGLYTNNASNNPGTLLGQTTLTNPVKQSWNTVALAPTTLTAATKYWIAVLGPTGAGTVQFRDVASGGKSQTSMQTTLTTLPAVWTPGTTYNNSPMSAYANQGP